MKTKIKQAPILLGDPIKTPKWTLDVSTKDFHSIMTFNNRDLAHTEYARIKNSSVFGGQWITEISLEEQM